MSSQPSLPTRFVSAPLTTWALLAIPAVPMLGSLMGGDLRHVIGPSGEFAARFLILSLMATPLLMLFPKARITRWLTARRRAIGVASALYAALHGLAYVLSEGALAKVMAALPHPGLWSGWAALALLVPLAVTSNDVSLRALGTAWKNLQRLAYPAAIIVLAHWLIMSHEPAAALLQVAPLALLEVYRVGRNFRVWKFRSAPA